MIKGFTLSVGIAAFVTALFFFIASDSSLTNVATGSAISTETVAPYSMAIMVIALVVVAFIVVALKKKHQGHYDYYTDY